MNSVHLSEPLNEIPKEPSWFRRHRKHIAIALIIAGIAATSFGIGFAIAGALSLAAIPSAASLSAAYGPAAAPAIAAAAKAKAAFKLMMLIGYICIGVGSGTTLAGAKLYHSQSVTSGISTP